MVAASHIHVTGMDIKGDRIVELAACTESGSTMESLVRLDDDVSIQAGAERAHNISDAVAHDPSLPDFRQATHVLASKCLGLLLLGIF